MQESCLKIQFGFICSTCYFFFEKELVNFKMKKKEKNKNIQQRT